MDIRRLREQIHNSRLAHLSISDPKVPLASKTPVHIRDHHSLDPFHVRCNLLIDFRTPAGQILNEPIHPLNAKVDKRAYMIMRFLRAHAIQTTDRDHVVRY